jgi:hypothetical protein
MDDETKVFCELCGEELRSMTYSLTMETIFMHNDLTGARCRRIQKQNKRSAK